MASPNLHPNVTAGQSMGDDHGGNNVQSPMPEPQSTGGLNSTNAGALLGSSGYTKAKKAAGAKKS